MTPVHRSATGDACALFGGAAGLVSAFLVPWQLAVLIGWDVMATVLLVWIWAEIGPADAAATQRWSGPEDSSHAAALVVMTAASVVSLAGMALGLIKARQSTQPLEAVLTVMAVLTVVLSWCVVHTMYTLRYAHLYYRDPEGGISFHTDQAPDYHDFAYLAFTVGMAFAVSDTDLTGRRSDARALDMRWSRTCSAR